MKNKRDERSKKTKSIHSQVRFFKEQDLFGLLLIVQIVITFIALFHAWTLQYKNVDGNASFIQRISFTSQDPPWTPPGTTSSAILHLHHFGDWTLALAYSRYAHPYDLHLSIPAVTPPLGMLILKILSILGDKFSFIVLSLLTLFIWISICNRLLSKRSYLERATVLFFFVAFSLPSINVFDRGGEQLCLMGLVGISLINFENRKYRRAAIWLLIAISFKPYLVVLSFWVLRHSKDSLKIRWSKLLKFWTLTLLLNASCMSIFNSNIFSGLKDYILATSRYSRDFIIPWVMDSASLMGFISKTIEGFTSSKNAEKFLHHTLPWATPIAGILLLVVLVGSLNPRTPKIIGVPLLLSMTSIIEPPAMEYTLVWVSLAIIYVLSQLQESKFSEITRELSILYRLSFVLLMLAGYLNVTPYFGFLQMPSGVDRHQPASYFYVPLIIVAAILTIFSVVKGQKKFSLAPAKKSIL